MSHFEYISIVQFTFPISRCASFIEFTKLTCSKENNSTYIGFRGVGTGVRLADNESVSVVSSGSSFSLSLPNGFVEIL